jgi:hypothetical protein
MVNFCCTAIALIFSLIFFSSFYADDFSFRWWHINPIVDVQHLLMLDCLR